jgi:hypothetical protein
MVKNTTMLMGFTREFTTELSKKKGNFCWKQKKIVPGVGVCIRPVAFFDDSFEWIYIYE